MTDLTNKEQRYKRIIRYLEDAAVGGSSGGPFTERSVDEELVAMLPGSMTDGIFLCAMDHHLGGKIEELRVENRALRKALKALEAQKRKPKS